MRCAATVQNAAVPCALALAVCAVGMQDYTPELLEAALKANIGGGKPVDLLLKENGRYRHAAIDVRTGVRYPVLERIEGTRDWLTEILSPR